MNSCLTLSTVKEALKRGKRLHIVHHDWFEFSAVHEKREHERDYSMRNILAKQNFAKREKARIEKGKLDGEKFVNTSKNSNYYLYRTLLTRFESRHVPYLQRPGVL